MFVIFKNNRRLIKLFILKSVLIIRHPRRHSVQIDFEI